MLPLTAPFRNNYVVGNLVLGTIKDMDSKASGFDTSMPSSFYVFANNYIDNNVAAGSDRYCFTNFGLPCASSKSITGSFRNNSAHSCLVGLLLKSSPGSQAAGCTLLKNFTTYMNWGEHGTNVSDGGS